MNSYQVSYKNQLSGEMESTYTDAIGLSGKIRELQNLGGLIVKVERIEKEG